MSDPAQLPHLLRLVDDPSPTARHAVARELAGFGDGLDAALDRLDSPPGPALRVAIQDALGAYRRSWLLEVWPKWYSLGTSAERLEGALGLLASFQEGPCLDIPDPAEKPFNTTLAGLLDDLSDGFGAWAAQEALSSDAEQLAAYLFREKRLCGERLDYYDPRNSNLVYVIRSGRGIPISLASIYMLVGHRRGIAVTGCNWPGHFLARAWRGGTPIIVDCFEAGKCVEEEAFLRMQGPSWLAAKTVLSEAASPECMVMRVLRNLSRAYQQRGNRLDSQLMVELSQDLRRFL